MKGKTFAYLKKNAVQNTTAGDVYKNNNSYFSWLSFGLVHARNQFFSYVPARPESTYQFVFPLLCKYVTFIFN